MTLFREDQFLWSTPWIHAWYWYLIKTVDKDYLSWSKKKSYFHEWQGKVSKTDWICVTILELIILEDICDPWCSGYHNCTASFNEVWTQEVLRRFKPCLQRAGDCDDLWQMVRLKIRLNVFRRQTITQKRFIIIVYMYSKKTLSRHLPVQG